MDSHCRVRIAIPPGEAGYEEGVASFTAAAYPYSMCGGRCKGCCGRPEFRAWHEGSAQAISVEVRWPALGMVVELIQAVPVNTTIQHGKMTTFNSPLSSRLMTGLQSPSTRSAKTPLIQ